MPLVANQLLKYNGTKWTNSLASISELSDVSLGSVSDTQVLAYSSSLSKWTNQTVSGGGGYTSGTLAIGVGLQQDLSTDNTVINGQCDEFGAPSYISVTTTSASVPAMKVRAQGQVFTSPATTINFSSLYPGSKKQMYWLYADYNSGSPVVASTRVAPETYYRRCFPSGTYLNFENGLSDPFWNLWVPSTGVVTLSSAQAKFGTKSYPIAPGQELVMRSAEPAPQDYGTYPSTPRYAAAWMFDCFFYPTTLQANSYIIGAYPGAYTTLGAVFYMQSTTAMSLYLSSNNSTWNIASNISVGNPVLNSWNYLGLMFDGTKYVANLNGNLTTVTSTAVLYPCDYLRLGAASAASSMTGFFDDVCFTLHPRPWRDTAVSAIDTTTLSTFGPSFASYLTYANSLVDSYGFNWYLNTGTLTSGSSKNGVTSMQVGGTQFLQTPFFPRLSFLDEWTIEGWFNCPTTLTDIFDARYRDLHGISTLVTSTQITIWIGSFNGSSWDILSGVTYNFPVPGLGVWRHVAVTYSSVSGYVVYVDGVSAITTTLTLPAAISNVMYLGRNIYDNTISPVYYVSEFRVTPWVVYTAAFTPPSTQLTVNASRDILDTTTNSMITEGANAGTNKRVYLGMVRPKDLVANHYAVQQSILPALTSGNVTILRDGSMISPKTGYSILQQYDNPFYSNMILRNDGLALISRNNGFGTNVSSSYLSEYNFIPTLPKIKQIAAQMTSAFFVDYNGNVFGAGNNYLGSFGNGSPSNTVYAQPTLIYSGTAPVVYAISNSYRAINNSVHYCAFIFDSGSIYAAGSNDVGQLGVGSASSSILTWTQVPKQGGNNWGGLRSNGRCTWFWTDDASGNLLYASGLNTSAQLGIGSVVNVNSPNACKFGHNVQVSNVKMVSESIQSDTPVFNAYVLLKNGDVYVCGQAPGLGTRWYSITSATTGFIGPIIQDVNTIHVSGGEEDHGILVLKNDGEIFSAGLDLTFRNINTTVGVKSFLPARFMTVYPLKNISAVKHEWNSGYSFWSCISRDGKLYAGGTLNSNNNQMGGPIYSSSGVQNIGWEMSFPAPVVDAKPYFGYNGSSFDTSHQVVLANGSVYASGSANVTCNNIVSGANTFIKLNLP